MKKVIVTSEINRTCKQNALIVVEIRIPKLEILRKKILLNSMTWITEMKQNNLSMSVSPVNVFIANNQITKMMPMYMNIIRRYTEIRLIKSLLQEVEFLL